MPEVSNRRCSSLVCMWRRWGSYIRLGNLVTAGVEADVTGNAEVVATYCIRSKGQTNLELLLRGRSASIHFL